MSEFYQLTPRKQGERMRGLAVEALRLWNIADADLELLKFRENAVFSVATKSAERYALRIHRYGYHTDAELRSELQWIQALDAEGIDVPPIVPSISGKLFEVVHSFGVPEPRQVDMLGWVDGQQLGSVEGGLEAGRESLQETHFIVGELAARLHDQATAWELPPGFTRHAWDADGIAGEKPFWGRFWELEALAPGERHLLERTRDRLRQDLLAYGKAPEGYSLIHADFAPENLLVDGDRVRLLDFDDAGFGWHLFEIVTSLYFHLGEEYYETVRNAVIEGYRSVRPLPDEQLEHLPLFLLARGVTYLGWVHTRKETETARQLTPMLIEAACTLAEEYLSS